MKKNNWLFSFILALLIAGDMQADQTPQNYKEPTDEEMHPIIQRSLEYAKGNKAFKDLYFKEHEKEFIRLVKDGQSPKALFIGCSDSRVVPDLIASTRPGDLFVIRTAGNFVPTYDTEISWDGVAATLEYAIDVLKISDIIVCGHSHCGAIQGLFANKEKGPGGLEILKKWLRFGDQAKKMTLLSTVSGTTLEEMYGIAGRMSVIFQLEHLLTFPFVKQKVDEQKVYLHGWYYTIETGVIEYYDPQAYQFLPLTGILQKDAVPANR